MALTHAQPTRPGQGQLPPEAVVFAKAPFRGLAPETEQMLRVPQNEANQKLAKMVKAWERFQSSHSEILREKRDYNDALTTVSGIKCSAKDLEEFIEILPNLDYNKRFFRKGGAGIFISALIDDGCEDAYTIQTERLGKIDHLGAFNKKHVVIEGDVGDDAGYGMESGELRITGNAHYYVGIRMSGGDLIVEMNADMQAGSNMTGGNLTIKGDGGGGVGAEMCGGILSVEGNAGPGAGDQMHGGKLVILGNADAGVGWWVNNPTGMVGGEIHILGKCRSIGWKIYGGKIFVGGKQAYPRGPGLPNELEKDAALCTPQHDAEPRLTMMVEAWKQFMATWERISQEHGGGFDILWMYAEALNAVSEIRCTAKEVEAFIAILPRLEGGERILERVGFFISAMVNSGPEDTYTIETRDFGIDLHFLGYKNVKNLVIKGDAGSGTGYEMESGTILVEGNARCCGDTMDGGRIRIEGNVNVAGLGMSGGMIDIQGECKNIGACSGNGTIRVGGWQVYPPRTSRTPPLWS